MSKKLNGASSAANGAADRGDTQVFVTMTVAGQPFGVPVLTVQDVLAASKITHVPLAPPEVAGSLNLRGRIVTAIDMRVRLGLTPRDADCAGTSIVVDHEGELYSLIVDEVGDVLSLPTEKFERNSVTLDPVWRDVSAGLFQLKEGLLVVLGVARLLDASRYEAA